MPQQDFANGNSKSKKGFPFKMSCQGSTVYVSYLTTGTKYVTGTAEDGGLSWSTVSEVLPVLQQ